MEAETKIGINIHAQRIDGDLELLKRDLAAIAEIGYASAEIPVNGVDAVVNGKLREGRTRKIKEVLSHFDLEYTVHAPSSLNLRDFRYPETHRRVFESCIEFTAKIGAKRLIYHQGRLVKVTRPQPHFREERLEPPEITEEEARELEVEALTDLGKLASSCGVQICIENTYASITHLIRLVEDIKLESVGICYDFGHSYINSKRIGYDFIRSIKLAKPYIYHVHIHDNFGKGEPEVLIPYIEGMPMGIGDLHLPVGWGNIPYEEALKALGDYKGIYTIELERRFFEDGYTILSEALEGLKEVLEKIKVRA